MQHYGASKRILCYIAGTLNYGIWYTQVTNFRLVGFTDSDWASSLDDRRSTSGNVFGLGSGAITWCSKKQATAALSTAEAEYMVAATVACQSIWLRRMLCDLQQKQERGSELYCDNKSTIIMSKNLAFPGRTKHIELRFHLIQELVTKSEIIMKFCNTEVQVADIFIKALSSQRHAYLKALLGVCDFESRGSVGDIVGDMIQNVQQQTSAEISQV